MHSVPGTRNSELLYEYHAQRAYSALLYLYPGDFRRSYSGELTLLFLDMYRASGNGWRARVSLWLGVLLDIASSAAKERIKTMKQTRWATVVSIILCLPLLFVIFSAALNYEPPFVDQYLTAPDGYSPTPLARVFMVLMLLSVPTAFAINLVPMLTKATPTESPISFKPTRTHTIAGLAILLILVIPFSQLVLNELEPFVLPLGGAAILGQGICLLGLLAIPVAFMLNRMPAFLRDRFRPTSVNLIIGAAILLVVLMLVAGLGLENLACASGVPNCD